MDSPSPSPFPISDPPLGESDTFTDETLILVFEIVFAVLVLAVVVMCYLFGKYKRKKRSERQIKVDRPHRAPHYTPSMIECALERHEQCILQRRQSFESTTTATYLPPYLPPDPDHRLPEEAVRRLSQINTAPTLLPKYSEIFLRSRSYPFQEPRVPPPIAVVDLRRNALPPLYHA